jgi:putative endonuclease
MGRASRQVGRVAGSPRDAVQSPAALTIQIPLLVGFVILNKQGVTMHFVYILRNEKGKHYIGETSDLEKRLNQHNSDNKHFTGNNGLWELVIFSTCQSKSEAVQLEKKLKNFKNPKYAIKYLTELNSG